MTQPTATSVRRRLLDAAAEPFADLLDLLDFSAPGSGPSIPLPTQPALWASILGLARRHSLSPLLYTRLRERKDFVPRPTFESLREDYRENAFRNLQFRAQLSQLSRGFREAGVPFLVLKGMHLIHGIYEDPSTRVSGDIDLLVRPQDLEKARSTLCSLGYRGDSVFRPGDEARLRHHLRPFSQPGRFAVEIHWTITLPSAPYASDPNGLWERRLPLTGDSEELFGLSLEDLLFHLCIHAIYQHQLDAGLRPSCDVAELIRRRGEELDWDAFLGLADRRRHRRGIYLALRLAHELVGAGVPAQILEPLSPRDAESRALSSAVSLLVQQREDLRSISREVAHFSRARSWRQGIGTLTTRVFLPKLELARIYQVRPDSRLLKRWSPSVARLIRREPASAEIADARAYLSAWLSKS